MSYTLLASISIAAVVVADLWVLRTRLLCRRSFWVSYVIILFFQLLVNGVLTGLAIVQYDPHTILGLRIVYAPVEDLAFGFALITLTLSCWVRLTSSSRATTQQREPS